MSLDMIKCANELAACFGLVAGTIFWAWVFTIIFGRFR